MDLTAKTAFIAQKLNELYPEVKPALDFSNHYTLLIAVLLSAQCTDVRVNKVTPTLFALADSPFKMVQLSINQIREIIYPCGLSPQKSKAIFDLSMILIDKHLGEVPDNFNDLEALPGVGHKTASVVMSQGFGVPAFPVDTHIHRLAERWGLSTGKSVKKTESDLKLLFPMNDWNKLHLQMIYFGREYCKARMHKNETCPICCKVATF